MAGQQIGRLGKVFVKDAATYGVAPTLVATDAFKHLDMGFRKTNNRSNSLERRGTPGLENRFSRHIEAGFDLRSAYLSPSGTLKTVPNARVFLKHAFGTERIGALSTTVASGPTTTGATLTSGTGLAQGDCVLINCTGGSFPGAYARVLKSVAGAVVTWGPALPQAPAVADTVKDGVTYRLANTLPAAGVHMAKYLPDVSWELFGAVIEKLGLQFDGNDECKFSASGPAMNAAQTAQAQPGAFTAVGSPVTGISGYLYRDNTAIKATKFDFEINNMAKLINDSFGTDRAEDHFRNGRRDVTISLEQRLLSTSDFYDLAEDATDFVFAAQAGTVEGRILFVYCPRVELDIPDIADPDGEIIPSYKGVCKETAAGLDGASTGGNDELILGLL